MTAAKPANSAVPGLGGLLTDADYAALERSWISRDLADQALLGRVISVDGAAIVGRKDNGSYAGIVFSYVWPGEDHVREYWLRRDRPEIERDAQGKPKEKNKYLGPPGRGNLLYITPGTRPELLTDVGVPIVITEGAKKTIALHRLSTFEAPCDTLPHFLAVGLGGVWSFKGTIGKVAGPDGSRRDEKGLISDLHRLTWAGRRVYIAFDSNVHTNPKVAAARRQLTAELRKLGAEVHWVNLPHPDDVPGINGVDDLLVSWGPNRVLSLVHSSKHAPTAESDSNQAEVLVRLCESVELFRTPEGESYGYVRVGDHGETWMLRSKAFTRWLSRQFHSSVQKPPRSQSLHEAIALLEAKAQFESPVMPVWVRVAEHDGRIYVDLCNAAWDAVEISPEGWRIVANPPVRFRRTKGMLPLPRPVQGGCVTALRSLINVGEDDNWVLCLAWLIAALRPKGPYPILLLQGEQGTAKSTMVRLLRRLIDPVVAPVRTPPRSDRDLLIAAVNSWVIAYDNLSGIPHWLSDALCRLVTGGGLSTRELYTDSDEIIFDASRPVILNGIDHLADRADLADRALVLHLSRIESKDRRDEREINAAFEQESPRILGALYTAVSVALSMLGQVTLAEMPRMADFALWAVAGLRGFDISPEAFLSSYQGNRNEAVRDTLEGDAVATAILELMAERQANGVLDFWEGSCKQLLRELDALIDDGIRKSSAWPKTPRGLSGRIRRIATFFRESGIEIAFRGKGGKGQRVLTIATTAVTATRSSDESQLESDRGEHLGGGPQVEVAVPANGYTTPPPVG
jgi:hypothetical protein